VRALDYFVCYSMHHVYVYALHLCDILFRGTLMVVLMVVRHDFMLICDIFMSCVWLILLCFCVFTPMYYEPHVFISYCIHLTYLDAGW